MDTLHKTKKHRALFVRFVKTKKLATSSVVLDQLGFVKQRNGGGVLRLKLVGPVEELRTLRLDADMSACTSSLDQ